MPGHVVALVERHLVASFCLLHLVCVWLCVTWLMRRQTLMVSDDSPITVEYDQDLRVVQVSGIYDENGACMYLRPGIRWVTSVQDCIEKTAVAGWSLAFPALRRS